MKNIKTKNKHTLIYSLCQNLQATRLLITGSNEKPTLLFFNQFSYLLDMESANFS